MSQITEPIILDSTGQEIVSALNAIAIAEAGGVDQNINWTGKRTLVDQGLGPKAMPVGTIDTVDIETGITISSSAQLEGLAIDVAAFIEAVGEAADKTYEFVYDGVVWRLDGNTVSLGHYGITYTSGTPSADDSIVVVESESTQEIVVLDHDYDTPANDAHKHTMTQMLANCLENMQFDAPEALFYVDPTVYPSGLAANETYTITVVNGAYNGSAVQDGTYGFVPATAVPAGGYVRHSVLGVYRSDSTYTKAQVLAGKFITYGTDFAQIEQLDTTETSAGTNLGTTTAMAADTCTPHMNFTQRQAHGCNRWDQSNIRQRLNSVGTGWFVKQNEWDFPPAGVDTMVGFMSRIDPNLKKVLKKTKKVHALSACDGGGSVITEDYIFLISMTEANLGTNNSINETSFGMDDTQKTVPYAYYVGAGAADRIKKLGASARDWWLRGPNPAHAYGVRNVNTSGALSGNYASRTYGLSPAWNI